MKNSVETHTQISVRLSNDLLKQIEAFTKVNRRNRSNAIEYLLWQAMAWDQMEYQQIEEKR